VKKHFAELSPAPVSYEDFWKRYFYRCNEERIARQLAEETERARQARAAAIENGIAAVTNLFGGAMKAVTDTIAPEDDSGEARTTATGKKSFFGAGGRPPFVMNTAVDESGDDDEEEMGWDDDDSDDASCNKQPSEVDSKTEQIEFTDKVSEDLKASLKQAIDERDQIQQTVHMQAEEIKELKMKLQGADGKGDLEAMKFKLFETEAELAAVKSKDHDDDMEDDGDKLSSLKRNLLTLSDDQLAQLQAEVFGISDESKVNDSDKLLMLEQQVQDLNENLAAKDAALKEAVRRQNNTDSEQLAALEKKVHDLTEIVSIKDAEIANVSGELESTSKELEANRSQLSSDQANANSALQEAEKKLQALQSSLDALQSKYDGLQVISQQAQADAAAQISALKANHAEEISSLTAQLKAATQMAKQNEEALKATEATLLATQQQPTTPTAGATQVEVRTPAFTTPLETTKHEAGDENAEGDDWDDDW